MSSIKRKDLKGRILHTGESQLKAGKFKGRYQYDYVNNNGERKHVNSWRLVETDPIPAGHRQCKALRTIEEEIARDLRDGINRDGANRITLNDFFDDYIKTKIELKPSTRGNYIYTYNLTVRNTIGSRKIASFKYSDIKKFYIYLIKERGFKPNSVECVHSILNPVFDMAVKDDYIRKNPAYGVLSEIKKSHQWDKSPRHALTIAEQEHFIKFIENSSIYAHWLPLFTFFLGTGCRIGEVISLTWKDVDFENGIISINHNAVYRKDHENPENGCYMQINTPKTRAGTREIPIFSSVKKALEEVREIDEYLKKPDYQIDGYTDFVFLNRDGHIHNPQTINRAIRRIIRDYNDLETENARQENREPDLIRDFSAHNLRHTFCTRMCEVENNVKLIQSIMGHADIQTTLDIYAECTREKKKESFQRLDGILKIN